MPKSPVVMAAKLHDQQALGAQLFCDLMNRRVRVLHILLHWTRHCEFEVELHVRGLFGRELFRKGVPVYDIVQRLAENLTIIRFPVDILEGGNDAEQRMILQSTVGGAVRLLFGV